MKKSNDIQENEHATDGAPESSHDLPELSLDKLRLVSGGAEDTFASPSTGTGGGDGGGGADC